ncbi:MAG TPA: DUF3124 domain-containing protein [Spirochaetota bacterium]|nr:DUF3124 domain-containing protein [Spirochaetota bacterium]
MMRNKKYYCNTLLLLVSILLLSDTPLMPQPGLSRGQTVYVPAYSHIYHGDNNRWYNLTVTLSIRNIDMGRKITINSVDYYNSSGRRLKRYQREPRELGPLESIRFIIPESDTFGGSGANFIVKWSAAVDVNNPVIEAVMIGSRQQQGISFVSRGRVILDK